MFLKKLGLSVHVVMISVNSVRPSQSSRKRTREWSGICVETWHWTLVYGFESDPGIVTVTYSVRFRIDSYSSSSIYVFVVSLWYPLFEDATSSLRMRRGEEWMERNVHFPHVSVACTVTASHWPHSYRRMGCDEESLGDTFCSEFDVLYDRASLVQ
jgi:hypothetical protein